MGKRLLTKDYDGFVKETFALSESDFFNHYSNIIDEHLQDNPELFQELEKTINLLFEWYKSKVHGKPIWVKFNDGYEPKEAGIYSNQHWYIKDGKRIFNDLLKNELDLYSYFGINRKIKGEFFEYQLEVLTRLRFKKENEDRYNQFKADFKDLLEPGKVSDINGFKSNLTTSEANKLYSLLLNKYIHKDTNKNHFAAIFKDEPQPLGFEPVIWIKKTKRGKTISYKALLDLLELAGVNEIDLAKMNKLFAKEKNVSIGIKSANVYNNKSNKNSEFYPELKTFFSTH
jgi:hypothetical protein